MIDAWGKAIEQAKKALESGGMFLKLTNDGDKVVVAFRGDPYPHDVHWTGQGYEDCTGKGCEHCAAGIRATLRVAFNVFVMADGTMKVMEGGARFFQDVVKVREKYGLAKYTFEIERRGAARDPKTTYQVLPDQPIDDELRARIEGVPLHDLGSESVRAAVAAEAKAPAELSPIPSVGASEVVPVEAARNLHEQLRNLDRESIVRFFERFGIGRVTELKMSDEREARRFIAENAELPF